MPTSATYTYSNVAVDPVMNTDDAFASAIAVALKVSTTFVAGTVIGKVTATGKYAAYASGNVDGSQIPVGILRRAATTDSSGNITNFDEWGATGLIATLFTQGAFKISDLTGLDDNAVTKLGGHVDGNGVANATILFF